MTDTKIEPVLMTTEELKERDETLVAVLSSESYDEAATKLGITPKALYNRRLKYKIGEIIAQMPSQALETLKLNSVRAAVRMAKGLNIRGEGLEAAKEILNRVGVKGDAGTTNVQVNNLIKIE